MQSHYPPLFLAASSNDVETINALAPTATAPQKNEALAQAASLGQLPAASALLAAGADPNAMVSPGSGTVFFAACALHNIEGITWLIENGADPRRIHKRRDGSVLTALDAVVRSPLRSTRKHQAMRLLIQHGVPLPATAEMAIHSGNVRALQEILDKHPNSISQVLDAEYGLFPLRGASLLHLATDLGELPMVTELLQRGAPVNHPAVERPAHRKRVAPTDLVSLGGQTSLFHCHKGSRELIEFLAERGADFSVRAPFLRRRKVVFLTPLAFLQEADRVEGDRWEELEAFRDAGALA